MQDERTHCLWCADLFSYPLKKDNFKAVMEKNAVEWEDSAYVVTDDGGKPTGFFSYNVNVTDNYGFLKFVIVDRELRGQGYGGQMVAFICGFAYGFSGVSSIRLNVFDVNEAALRCYEKVGFSAESVERDVFDFHEEKWGRRVMVHRKENFE